jgi:predicted MFS family arabinose efflux permease
MEPPQTALATGEAGTASSPWAPFRSPMFRQMAVSQFVSNVGGWMQTVGAQELMLTLTTSATLVALIQTAAGLPVVLLAVLAGAFGDVFDRRRLLLISQSFMLLAATALAVLALVGAVTPWVLLAAIFAVGVGQTFTSPTWQTLQPELVPPEDRTQAIALGSVNQNLSRAVGPAIGGALYAATSASALFFVNAASFFPVIGAVARWRQPPRPNYTAAPEQVRQAIRAGGRYVAASPALRLVLARAGAFMFCANSIWALLPLVARSDLHLGSTGYGLLLGGVGLGAVSGAAALPRLRARFTANTLLTVATFVLAGVTFGLAYTRATLLGGVIVVVAGVAWIVALSTLSSQYQGSLPDWAKARGMAYYLVVFQGGGAIGSAAFGVVAQDAGLTDGLIASGTLLAIGALVGMRHSFVGLTPEELLPAAEWPAPRIAPETTPAGPVMVSLEYRAKAGQTEALLEALHSGRYARRRTGAVSWQAWVDAADPSRVCEQFVVGSWDEHLRQHERISRRDRQRLDTIDALTEDGEPSHVTHWLRGDPGPPKRAGPAKEHPS